MSAERDALRQRALLEALASRDDAGFDAVGLAAYRGNAGAAAARALEAAFPTVQQLIGDEAFGPVARALWRQHPPRRGDLAQWGAELPAFVAADPQLADVPYLADVACVDWAVHVAGTAADATLDPAALNRLAEHDAGALQLRLAPGAALIESPFPVAALWWAHRSEGDHRFAAARAALAAGEGEAAFVWRQGWRPVVEALDASTADFIRAVLRGASLAEALDAAPALDFETWLVGALQRQWLAGVEIRS